MANTTQVNGSKDSSMEVEYGRLLTEIFTWASGNKVECKVREFI